jgi:hypothetical protein
MRCGHPKGAPTVSSLRSHGGLPYTGQPIGEGVEPEFMGVLRDQVCGRAKPRGASVFASSGVGSQHIKAFTAFR